MNVNIEEPSTLRRKLTIEVEPDEIKRELDKAFNELKRGVVLKGFRPGHAPRNLLERFFGEQVRTEVMQKLVKEFTDKALEEHSLKTAITRSRRSRRWRTASRFLRRKLRIGWSRSPSARWRMGCMRCCAAPKSEKRCGRARLIRTTIRRKNLPARLLSGGRRRRKFIGASCRLSMKTSR